MQTAKSLGKQEKKDRQIQILLEVFGAIFAFLPFLDDLAPALELVDGLWSAVAQVGSETLLQK